MNHGLRKDQPRRIDLKGPALMLNRERPATTLNPNLCHGIEEGMPLRNLSDLIQRKLLVQGHIVLGNDPLVTLKMDADKRQKDAMLRAPEDWNDGERDASEGFPSVSAVLSIQFASAGQQLKTFWKNSTTLAVAATQAVFGYSEPALNLAVLSDSRKRLYLEIALVGDNIERHFVIMPGAPK